MDSRIFHVTKLISQNMGHSWCVEEMSSLVGLSASHFQKLFREKTGHTPIKYLNDIRLAKAHEYLSDPECFLRIKEICSLVGIANANHFSRDFKKKFGITPIQYRERMAELYTANLKMDINHIFRQ